MTIRAFVYGDEAWFEKYEDFSKRLKIEDGTSDSKKSQADDEYVCIAPIRVNGTPMGVLMLTGFNDKKIEKISIVREF